ncbi:hypothetical protein WME99_37205 [Sorangium sp. So ce136]|uniref:hypothetical protein n=1 Tax=Sorangium sp. So ce136 TaxID=3133284 RepID=UPI003F020047
MAKNNTSAILGQAEPLMKVKRQDVEEERSAMTFSRSVTSAFYVATSNAQAPSKRSLWIRP